MGPPAGPRPIHDPAPVQRLVHGSRGDLVPIRHANRGREPAEQLPAVPVLEPVIGSPERRVELREPRTDAVFAAALRPGSAERTGAVRSSGSLDQPEPAFRRDGRERTQSDTLRHDTTSTFVPHAEEVFSDVEILRIRTRSALPGLPVPLSLTRPAREVLRR